ncbi:MAG: hypoxanthine phosphoribosyltransferase [Thermoguttaceae bacterium]|nr:hypoxanthine phosphoribosyltransferase [Thermoguttaceae bacterium]
MQQLFSAAQIRTRVQELGNQISADYAARMTDDEPPVLLLGVLRGAFIFLADLCRELTIPAEIEFIQAASYGQSTQSSGVVQLQPLLNTSLAHRKVLVVEDIIDSGRSLQRLLEYLHTQHPQEIRTCVMCDKQVPRAAGCDVQVDYTGLTVPPVFIAGYGLDGAQGQRHLPDIWTCEDF